MQDHRKETPRVGVNVNYFNIDSDNNKSICETFGNSFSFFACTYVYLSRLTGVFQWQ